MIKVANVIEEGRLGGPQRRIVSVASACSSEIKTVVFLPSYDSEGFTELCEKNQIEYKLINFSSARKSLTSIIKYIIFYVPEVLFLAKLLKKGNFDLVHVSGGSWQSKGVVAAKIAKQPVIWHLNDSSMPGIIRFVFSMLSTIPNAYIFSSHRTKEYYQPCIRRKPKHEIILPAPVDTRAYEQIVVTDHKSLKNRFGGRLIVGTLANVNPIKGIEAIIELALILKKYEAEVEFIVCGAVHQNQAPYYEKLISKCQENGVINVSFIGFTDAPDLFLSEVDIYLCSSLAESSPTAVWEAMASATPVVSFDVGDVLYQLKNANAGFVVPLGDLEGLARGVESYIKSPELRVSDGKNLQASSTSELDIEVVGAAYRGFCKKISGN